MESCLCYNCHDRRTSIAEGIRPAAQPLLVEYARNVGPPLFATQPSRDDDPLIVRSQPNSTGTPYSALTINDVPDFLSARLGAISASCRNE